MLSVVTVLIVSWVWLPICVLVNDAWECLGVCLDPGYAVGVERRVVRVWCEASPGFDDARIGVFEFSPCAGSFRG